MSKPPDIHAYYLERLGKPGSMADRVAARKKQARADTAAEADSLARKEPRKSRETTHDWGWIRCHLYYLIRTGHVIRLKAQLRKEMEALGKAVPDPDDKTLLRVVKEIRAEYRGATITPQREVAQKSEK